MGSIKDLSRNMLPPVLYNSLVSGKDFFLRLVERPSVYFHPWWRNSAQRLMSYQDRFEGERCFVIGNGPSLKGMDVSYLKDEYTFGMNRIYLAFKDWGFQTSFLVSVNDLVIEQCSKEFQELEIPKFISWRAKNVLYPKGNPDQHTQFIYTSYTGKKFSKRTIDRFWEGATVTYVCLQLAFCMGFREVILIGVDHAFDTKGKANQTVISDGDDPNHFSPAYFGKGFRWQLPDLDTSELAYQIARDNYQKAGRKVLDATVGGKLNVFHKVDYLSLFH
jgi:hypothetical protein